MGVGFLYTAEEVAEACVRAGTVYTCDRCTCGVNPEGVCTLSSMSVCVVSGSVGLLLLPG